MPTPISNAFTEFEFTKAEWYAATRFTSTQLMLFQTLLARAATRRVNMNISPDDKKSIQEEAEIKGEMGAYEGLLSMFSDAEAPEVEDENKPETQTEVSNISTKGKGI